jgi:hypothetical protein
MNQVYHDLFTDNQSIIDQFNAPQDALEGATVYFAWYSYEDYSGTALVVFEKDGRLYEVNGSHCSCYGLEEGGWQLEETSWEALAVRKMYNEDCDNALAAVVKKHMKQGKRTKGKK